MLRIARTLDGDGRIIQADLAHGFAEKLLELLLQTGDPVTFWGRQVYPRPAADTEAPGGPLE